MKTKELPYSCCKKMHEVLQYKDSAFKASQKNLIAIQAGFTEMEHKSFSEAIKKIMNQQKYKDKTTIFNNVSNENLYDEHTKRTVRIAMTEIISFSIFVVKKLVAK